MWTFYLSILLTALALDVLLFLTWRRLNQRRAQQNAAPIDWRFLRRHFANLGFRLTAWLQQVTLLMVARALFGQGRWRLWGLALAVRLAVIAQRSFPPPNVTLSDQIPLPQPLWKTLLFMPEPLAPFRQAVWLYLLAMALVIVAFSGRATLNLPWRALQLFGSPKIPTGDSSSFSQTVFGLQPDIWGLELRFRGPQTLWRAIIPATILIFSALCLAGYVFFLFYGQGESNPGLALWLLSLFVLLAAVATYESLKRASDHRPALPAYLWIIGASVLVGVSVWFLWAGRGIPGMLTWLGGVLVLCAGWGITLRRYGPERPARPPAPPTSRWLEGLVFIALLGVAGYFRLARIGELAPGLNNDAAEAGRLAIHYALGQSPYTPFAHVGWGFETLFIYLIAGWMRVVGFNFVAIRLAAATAGIGAIAGLYFLGRRLGGPRLAWLGAALLATSGIHIVYSGVGYRLILQPLLEALTLLFFWQALTQRRLRHFVLAGLALGLAVHAHNSSRAYPLLFVVFVLFLLFKVASRRREFLRRYSVGLLICVVSALIAIAPIAAYALSRWSPYNDRANHVFVGRRMKWMEETYPGSYWSPLARNIVVGSLIFNQRGNGNDFFIEDPAFDFPVTILFILGIAYALRHWRAPLPFFLLTWFFLAVFTGYLSEPNANRTVGAIVPAYLMLALFLLAAADLAVKALGARWRPVVDGSGLLLMLTIGFLAYQDYVGPNYRYRWGYGEEASAVADYINQIRDDYAVYLTPSYYITDTVRLITYRAGEDPYELPYSMFNEASFQIDGFPDERNVAVVLGNWLENVTAQSVLLERYPGSRSEPIPAFDLPGRETRPAGYAVLIPREAVSAPAQLKSGLLSKYYAGPNWEGEPYQVFVDRFMSFPPHPLYVPFSAAWEGAIQITTPGSYLFRLRNTNRAQLFLDGVILLTVDNFDPDNPHERHEAEAAINLTEGVHTLLVQYSYEAGDREVRVYWMPPDTDSFELLPLEAFTPAAWP